MEKETFTILLAEDDPNDVILVQRAFHKANLANPIQVVTDGEQVVAYLEGEESYADRGKYPFPILLLLDLKMPRKSGIEVLKWLRGKPGLKRLPVVVLTSSDNVADVNQAYDLGANSYLVKPVSFEGLVEMVKGLDLYWMILNEAPDTRES